MAITFDAGTDTVNWGDVSQFDGLTAFTLSVWANLTDVANTATGRRWVAKWGNVAGGLSFLLGQADGDGNDLVLAVSGDGATSTFSAYGSTTNILATGTDDHYVMTWDGANAGTPFTLRKNDAAIALTNLFTTGTRPTVLPNVATVFTYGQDGATVPLNGVLGTLWEVGMWNRLLNASEKTMLALACAPSMIPRGLIHYADCIRDVKDRRQGTVPTLTSVDVAPHRKMIYPGRRRLAMA